MKPARLYCALLLSGVVLGFALAQPWPTIGFAAAALAVGFVAGLEIGERR